MATITLKFGGVNNRLDPAVLGRIENPRDPVLTELVEAVNVDLGDRMEAVVRPGYLRKVSGAPHSGWATADGSRAYCVEAGVLKQFLGTSVTTLLPLSTNDPCVFEEVNNVIVFTNGTDIGLVDAAGAYLFTTPSGQFKRPMPAGQALAFYGGCLWVARQNVLTRSDPYDIEQADERLADIPLSGIVTLLAAVDDGLWVGYGGVTAFLKGGDAAYAEIVPYNAIIGTACRGKAEWFGAEGFAGNVVVWRSSRGVCLGGAGGRFANLSEEQVAMSTGDAGAATLRHFQGRVHYVSAVRGAAAAHNAFVPEELSVNSVTI
jgi:hypothetical protein